MQIALVQTYTFILIFRGKKTLNEFQLALLSFVFTVYHLFIHHTKLQFWFNVQGLFDLHNMTLFCNQRTTHSRLLLFSQLNVVAHQLPKKL